MGACASCLGQHRDRDYPDEDEQSRLLFEDQHVNAYGSFGDHNAGTIQTNPQEVQRENEALQRVVVQTSNHLVDIFSMNPQDVPSSTTAVLPSQDAKLLRYQDVLSKLSESGSVRISDHQAKDNKPFSQDAWASDDDEEDIEVHVVKPEGRLLGGFDDVD